MNNGKSSQKTLGEKELEALRKRLAASEAKYADLDDEGLDAAEEELRTRIAAVGAKTRPSKEKPNLSRTEVAPASAPKRWRSQMAMGASLVAAGVLGVVLWPKERLDDGNMAGSLKGAGTSEVCHFEIRDGKGTIFTPGENPPPLAAGEALLMLGSCAQDGYLHIQFAVASDAAGNPALKEFRNVRMMPTASHRPLTSAKGEVVGLGLPTGKGKLDVTWSLTASPLSDADSIGEASGSFSFPFGQ